MPEKTIDPMPVEIDEASLSSLGWTAQDVRARLVTQVRHGAVTQHLAVAGSMRFEPADGAEHFTTTGDAPHVLLTLNRRGGVTLPSYGQAVAERADIAVRRPTRFTETSEPWSGSTPTTPDDLRVRLTGFDLENVERSFSLPSDNVTALPVTVVDESTWPSLRVNVNAVAEVTRGERHSHLRVQVEGLVEPGSLEELLEDRAAHSAGPFDSLAKAPRVHVPGFVVEVTDDEDFLLAQRVIPFHGAIAADDQTRGAIGSPRIAGGFRTSTASWAGTPTRIVLRVRDAAELRLF